MFDNIGEKIKILARANFVIGAFASGILFIYELFENEEVGLGFLFLICGVGIAYIISMLIYGYGTLVCNSEDIKRNTITTKCDDNKEPVQEPQAMPMPEPVKTEKSIYDEYMAAPKVTTSAVPDGICKNCGCKYEPGASFCPICGTKLN